jgi:hypothetical protein
VTRLIVLNLTWPTCTIYFPRHITHSKIDRLGFCMSTYTCNIACRITATGADANHATPTCIPINVIAASLSHAIVLLACLQQLMLMLRGPTTPVAFRNLTLTSYYRLLSTFWYAVVSHRVASEITSASHLSTSHASDKRKRYYHSHTVHMPVRLARSAGIQRYIHRHGIGKHTVYFICKSCTTTIHERQTTTSQAQKPSHFHRPTSVPSRARRASS